LKQSIDYKFNLVIDYFEWEKVTTTNFTMSKTKKNIEKFGDHHYIKSPFLVDHYYDTSDVLISPMASKKITTSKIKISTTYGILPMVTKACGALGG
jgi:hypothetical protein